MASAAAEFNMNFKKFISTMDGGSKEVYINIAHVIDFSPDFLIANNTYVVLSDGRSHSLQINIMDFCKAIGVEVCQKENEKKLTKSKTYKRKSEN